MQQSKRLMHHEVPKEGDFEDDEAQQKHETGQPTRNLQEIFINWLPTDTKTFLFALVIVIDLMIGVIHFGKTGDTSMVMSLLGYAAAYVGLSEVKPLFAGKKREQYFEPQETK